MTGQSEIGVQVFEKLQVQTSAWMMTGQREIGVQVFENFTSPDVGTGWGWWICIPNSSHSQNLPILPIFAVTPSVPREKIVLKFITFYLFNFVRIDKRGSFIK